MSAGNGEKQNGCEARSMELKCRICSFMLEAPVAGEAVEIIVSDVRRRVMVVGSWEKIRSRLIKTTLLM